MLITIKLFSHYRIGRFKEAVRDYPEGTSVFNVRTDLHLPEEFSGVLLVNGRRAALDMELQEGDILTLFPFVSGG